MTQWQLDLPRLARGQCWYLEDKSGPRSIEIVHTLWRWVLLRIDHQLRVAAKESVSSALHIFRAELGEEK